ncbi:hypothetical protein [Mycobacterium sp. URHB0021]
MVLDLADGDPAVRARTTRRGRSIHGRDVSGPKQLGLLRRIENLYTRLPEHHERLQREQQAGETLIGGAEQISPLPIPTDSTGEITG